MIEFIFFIIGVMLGGLTGIVMMFNPDNLYYETLKTTIQNHEKGICPVAKKSKKAKRSKEIGRASCRERE